MSLFGRAAATSLKRLNNDRSTILTVPDHLARRSLSRLSELGPAHRNVFWNRRRGLSRLVAFFRQNRAESAFQVWIA